MAIILKANGQQVGIEPANGKDFSLEELKNAIGGGYIEIVRLQLDKKLIVCDEDGRSKGLPLNLQASQRYGNQVNGGDFVGDVLICKLSEIE